MKWFVFALMAISATVALGQIMRWNMWGFICLYWVVLAVKNAIELWSR